MRQMSAITGIKKKPRYREIINAQVPFLPAKYQLKEQKKYQEESLALERERLDKEEELALKGMEDYEKQSKKAGLVSLGQLGVTGYLGHQQNKALSTISSPKTGVTTGAAKTAPFSFTNKAGWGGAAKTMAPYAGGLTGIWAGKQLYGKDKGERAKRTVTGAAAGGATSYLLSGGNPYAMAIGAFIGGAGGLFS